MNNDTKPTIYTDMSITLQVSYAQIERMKELQARLRKAGVDWTIQQIFDFALQHGSEYWIDEKLKWAETQVEAYENL